jgi:hypothetical protein
VNIIPKGYDLETTLDSLRLALLKSKDNLLVGQVDPTQD